MRTSRCGRICHGAPQVSEPGRGRPGIVGANSATRRVPCQVTPPRSANYRDEGPDSGPARGHRGRQAQLSRNARRRDRHGGEARGYEYLSAWAELPHPDPDVRWCCARSRSARASMRWPSQARRQQNLGYSARRMPKRRVPAQARDRQLETLRTSRRWTRSVTTPASHPSLPKRATCSSTCSAYTTIDVQTGALLGQVDAADRLVVGGEADLHRLDLQVAARACRRSPGRRSRPRSRVPSWYGASACLRPMTMSVKPKFWR